MGKATGGGTGGHSPAGKTAAGVKTAQEVKAVIKDIDKKLGVQIADIRLIQRALNQKEAGGSPGGTQEGGEVLKRKEEELAQQTTAQLQKQLARAEAAAQQLLTEKARELQKLKSDEAKIAELRSEKGVDQFVSRFKVFEPDYDSTTLKWDSKAGKYVLNASTDPNGADGWGVPKYKAWAEGLQKGEFKAVQAYSGSGYGDVNRLLRFGQSHISGNPVTVQNTIKKIDSALQKAPKASEDIMAIRYFNLSSLYSHYKDHGTLNGAIVKDKGFVSSSLSKNWKWSGGFKAKILIPKGSEGAYINRNISGHHSEYEYVLPRNTKFKIIKTKPYTDSSGKSKTEITMIAYTPNHPKYAKLKPGFGE